MYLRSATFQSASHFPPFFPSLQRNNAKRHEDIPEGWGGDDSQIPHFLANVTSFAIGVLWCEAVNETRRGYGFFCDIQPCSQTDK